MYHLHTYMEWNGFQEQKMTSPANSDNHDTCQDGGQLLLAGTTNHPLKGKVNGNNLL